MFSEVRFLVLWVVAVWSMLDIETPRDFGGIFNHTQKDILLDFKYSQINPRGKVLQSVEC